MNAPEPAPSPVVSIVIPAYNAERTIEQTVRSALAQTFTDLEVIVGDDASTDRTVEIVRAIADPRLTVHESPVNISYEANWNRVTGMARGRYVMLLGHDDVLYPRGIEWLAAALDADTEGRAAFAVGRRDIIDPDGHVVVAGRGLRHVHGFVDSRSALRRLVWTGGNYIGEPSSILIRTDAVREAGPWSARYPYPIDTEMYHRLLKRRGFIALHDTVGTFRLSATQLSRTLGRAQGRQLGRLVREVAADPVCDLPALAGWWGYWRSVAFSRLRRVAIQVAFRRAARRRRSAAI